MKSKLHRKLIKIIIFTLNVWLDTVKNVAEIMVVRKQTCKISLLQIYKNLFIILLNLLKFLTHRRHNLKSHSINIQETSFSSVTKSNSFPNSLSLVVVEFACICKINCSFWIMLTFSFQTPPYFSHLLDQ
jgi:hypothetical protein